MQYDKDTTNSCDTYAVNWTPSFSPQLQQDPNALSAAVLNRLQLPAEQVTPNGIVPNAPYYDLPAGLMVPLVEPAQIDYKALKPSELRLPLPKFPDAKFLKAIDDYYGQDVKLRENDGWNKNFIDTYVNQKRALAEAAAANK